MSTATVTLGAGSKPAKVNDIKQKKVKEPGFFKKLAALKGRPAGEIAHTVLFRDPKPGIRADIQAMRALAVMAVVIYHFYAQALPGGFTGVDIFFVISGYLMTLHIVKGLEDGGFEKGKRLRFFADFYARRIRRLAPAALVVLASVLALVYIFLPYDYSTQLLTSQQVIASALFVQNWQLAGDAVDYLGQNNEATAVQHFWSLSVEEQFYFIWPLLLMLMMMFGLLLAGKVAKKKLDKQMSDKVAAKAEAKGYQSESYRTRNFIRVFIYVFTLASFIYGVYLTNSNHAAAYFVTPARIWELSFGGIVALSTPLIVLLTRKTGELSKLGRAIYELVPVIGLAVCVYGIIFLDAKTHLFPGAFALIPTVGAALIIWGGMRPEEQRFTK